MPMLHDTEWSWFEAGSGVLDGVFDDPACFPPLDDREAQRQWLGGFAGAWAELTITAPADPSTAPANATSATSWPTDSPTIPSCCGNCSPPARARNGFGPEAPSAHRWARWQRVRPARRGQAPVAHSRSEQ
jgi:hypothetical protein